MKTRLARHSCLHNLVWIHLGYDNLIKASPSPLIKWYEWTRLLAPLKKASIFACSCNDIFSISGKKWNKIFDWSNYQKEWSQWVPCTWRHANVLRVYLLAGETCRLLLEKRAIRHCRLAACRARDTNGACCHTAPCSHVVCALTIAKLMTWLIGGALFVWAVH